MKKLIEISMLSAVILMITAGSSIAQVSVGVVGGLHHSTIVVEDEEVQDYISINPTFHFGVASNFAFGNHFAIQPELLYSKKGILMKLEEDDVSSAIVSNYIEIPVLLQIKFLKGNLSPVVNFGPYGGYWISGKVKIEYLDENFESDINFKNEDNEAINRFDAGAIAGAGIVYKVGRGHLFLDGRYAMGLIPLSSKESDDMGANRNIGVTAGFLLTL